MAIIDDPETELAALNWMLVLEFAFQYDERITLRCPGTLLRNGVASLHFRLQYLIQVLIFKHIHIWRHAFCRLRTTLSRQPVPHDLPGPGSE